MPNLILSRHGNTFATGQTPVWVGAANDLPLVESGINQAENLAQALLDNKIMLDVIYCGPLERTREYAGIVREKLSLPNLAIVDERLNELDYGQWSGLTDAQVIEKFGKEDLENWNKRGIWPQKGNWGSLDAEVLSETKSFISDLLKLQAKNILVVTSNGRLRYFLKLMPDLYATHVQAHKLKVATGNVCLMTGERTSESNSSASLKLICWNEDPKKVLISLAQSAAKS